MNPFRRPYTVKTPSASKLVNGVVIDGAMTESIASFSVQSIKETQEIEALAEGRRLNDFRRLYSDTKLQITDDFDMAQPALVTIDGADYEIKHREPWQNGIVPHYKYYVVRKRDG
ncbi:conserved hypothetical protein [Erwinia phage phiEt88]|uniref:head protein n=1 Tax=Erwinia phage phiEt88 TaxID=925984 RepID=UPI0001F1FC5D|nr:head protein [Erwinia phage phiEt88]CBX44524.1 conserved hypothetical protein [Erwinia phage phiEt88]